MKFVNEAGWDRFLRIILGVVLLVLGWGNIVQGGFGDFLKYFGLLPLITGLAGYCPVYSLLKIRTRKS